jgi:hypothetical protein
MTFSRKQVVWLRAWRVVPRWSPGSGEDARCLPSLGAAAGAVLPGVRLLRMLGDAQTIRKDAILEGTLLGVTVTTERADDAAGLSDHGVESIDEQARRKGIRPIASADDLAQIGVFDTDEELYAFLAHVAAMRHADLA